MTAEKIPHIEKITLPDSDMPGWIEVFRNSDMKPEEIDFVLSQLNQTYAEKKGIVNVDAELKKIESRLLKEHGRMLTDEQREYMKQSILSRSNQEQD